MKRQPTTVSIASFSPEAAAKASELFHQVRLELDARFLVELKFVYSLGSERIQILIR